MVRRHREQQLAITKNEVFIFFILLFFLFLFLRMHITTNKYTVNEIGKMKNNQKYTKHI